MTPGWRISGGGGASARRCYFKEGGGGGFHRTLRVYRDAKLATIVLANATGFNSNACLDQLDASFL